MADVEILKGGVGKGVGWLGSSAYLSTILVLNSFLGVYEFPHQVIGLVHASFLKLIVRFFFHSVMKIFLLNILIKNNFCRLWNLDFFQYFQIMED